MSSRHNETLSERFECRLSPEVKESLERLTKYYFPHWKGEGGNSSEVVRVAIELLDEIAQECEKDTDILSTQTMAREPKLKRWLRKQIKSGEGGDTEDSAKHSLLKPDVKQ